MTTRKHPFGLWFLSALFFALAFQSVDAQTVYNRFGPANGILVGDSSTYITTPAASSDVRALWTGTCDATTYLRGDGTCGVPAGTGVTSVGLTVPSGLSVTGSPVTSSGTLAVTTTLNGVVKGDGSGFSAGTVNVNEGGTGAVTLSGVLKGNATSPISSAASTDVTALWSGTCDNTTFLRGDGTCAAGAGGSGGNPTATIGLTAVNGVSANFIRSDGAPALSQAIAPTWTATHTFGQQATGTIGTPAIAVSSGTPAVVWNETDGATDNKAWYIAAGAENLFMGVRNDAASVATDFLTVTRTGTTVDAATFAAPVISGSQQTVAQYTARGTATGNSALSWLEFQDSAGTRTGFVGDGSSGNNDITLRADGSSANLQLVAGSSGAVIASSNGILAQGFASASTTNGMYMGLNSGGGSPVIRSYASGAAVNQKSWTIEMGGASLRFLPSGDSNYTGLAQMELIRSSTGDPSDVWIPITTPPSTTRGALTVGAQESQVNATTFLSYSTPTTGYAAMFLSNDWQRNTNFWTKDTANNTIFTYFETENTRTTRGSISYNRGSGVVAYNTTSDRRLKEHIDDSVSAGNAIDAMKVRSFDWKDSGNHVDYGFIAQELYDVAPIAVTKGDDGDVVDAKTNPGSVWQVDNSKLVPMLVKELQDLRKRVAELEAR